MGCINNLLGLLCLCGGTTTAIGSDYGVKNNMLDWICSWSDITTVIGSSDGVKKYYVRLDLLMGWDNNYSRL